MAARRLAGRLVDEIGADTAGGLRPAVKMMAGENVFGPQPFGRGVEQNLLQRAAMDRKLRPFVTGLGAARLAPDRLAVLGKIREFPGAYARGIKLVEQAEFDQLAHRVRQHVDADAERLQFGDALEYFGRNADLMQAERQRQPADAAAGDEYGHETPLLLMASWHERRQGATRNVAEPSYRDL